MHGRCSIAGRIRTDRWGSTPQTGTGGCRPISWSQINRIANGGPVHDLARGVEPIVVAPRDVLRWEAIPGHEPTPAPEPGDGERSNQGPRQEQGD